ncbi:MAG: histidinol dehydrogenase [Bryobacteraceae bacterium]
MIRIISHLDARSVMTRRRTRLDQAERIVAPILEAVRTEGDAALIRYAQQFDELGNKPLRVSEAELASAAAQMASPILDAVAVARRNIHEFAEAQLPREYLREFSNGRKLGQIVRPLDAVGCYIPSGRYPLPSTLLMTAVPAQAAGVSKICVASPKPSVEILGCAHLLGLRNIFRIGGAQAIAAMAFGTATVPKVDRIVGPGNAYVAAAKKLLAGEVGIDFIAGPTEILILAPDGNPRTIAADMLAQAEHDTDAAAVLITLSQKLAEEVACQIDLQLAALPTAETARAAIEKNSAIIIAPDIENALELSNEFAPEHLSLLDASLLPHIRHAGTVFLGEHSPESAGDYAAGPSHVLPTSGAARLRGGLSAADFVKVIAVQQLSSDALRELAPSITALARAEGLEAHARSVEIRFA